MKSPLLSFPCMFASLWACMYVHHVLLAIWACSKLQHKSSSLHWLYNRRLVRACTVSIALIVSLKKSFKHHKLTWSTKRWYNECSYAWNGLNKKHCICHCHILSVSALWRCAINSLARARPFWNWQKAKKLSRRIWTSARRGTFFFFLLTKKKLSCDGARTRAELWTFQK